MTQVPSCALPLKSSTASHQPQVGNQAFHIQALKGVEFYIQTLRVNAPNLLIVHCVYASQISTIKITLKIHWINFLLYNNWLVFGFVFLYCGLKTFIRYWCYNNFLPMCALPFNYFNNVLPRVKVHNFNVVQFILFYGCVFSQYIKNSQKRQSFLDFLL